MTPEALVGATTRPINAIGAKYMFHPDTVAVGKEHNLDGFRWYVLGRGGVLGDVEPAVVTSAFGYFHPDTITKIWNSAKATMAPRDAGKRYLQCNADLGRKVLGDVAEDVLAGFCEAAIQVIADVNPAGLARFKDNKLTLTDVMADAHRYVHTSLSSLIKSPDPTFRVIPGLKEP